MNSPSRRTSSLRCLVATVLLGLSSACRSDVAFYEKAAFSDRAMDMSDEPLETHWYAKLHFSLEGSIGGIGTSGGGGCGCF